MMNRRFKRTCVALFLDVTAEMTAHPETPIDFTPD